MRSIILISVLSLFLCPRVFATAYGKVNSGNRAFKKGQYDKALEKYRDAQIADPGDEVINFDMGNALHKQGEFEKAQSEYEKVLSSKNPAISERTYYNLGNNSVMQRKTDEAIENYKKALDVNPNDINAKYNIEFLRLLKSNPAAVKNQLDGKEGKEKQGKGANGKQAQEQKALEGKENKKEEGKELKPENKGGMSKEDAERILQYYNDSEKQAAEKRKMRPPQVPKTEEDW